jgi:hypothetical protein
LFPCSVLTLKFQSELGKLGLDSRAAIMVIRDMLGITHIGTIDRTTILNHILIPITRAPITRAPRTTGTMGIGFTATTVIITTDIGTKLT